MREEVDAELAQGWDVGLDVDGVGVDEARDFGWREKEPGSEVAVGVPFGR